MGYNSDGEHVQFFVKLFIHLYLFNILSHYNRKLLFSLLGVYVTDENKEHNHEMEKRIHGFQTLLIN